MQTRLSPNQSARTILVILESNLFFFIAFVYFEQVNW